MTSRSSTTPRRIPQQKRGQRRVALLLRAAASVIAELGYEPATMCAIAQRATSSIGSLYQFFPNKEAVAEALRAQYIKELEKRWAVLAHGARTLTVKELVCQLVRSQIEFAESYPAFPALLDAPPTTNTSRRRELIRRRIARVLLARQSRMSKARALRLAAVVQQIVKGLLTLYARTAPGERALIVEEFKGVLIGYLAPRLNH